MLRTPRPLKTTLYVKMLPHSANEHPNFEHVDLWESYVIGWGKVDSELYVDIEAVLLPEHKSYEKPTPDLWACYKKAKIIFKGVTSIVGYEDLKADKPAIDANGEKDFGHIEEFEFTKLGDYVFTIELAGTLQLQAKELSFEIQNV